MQWDRDPATGDYVVQGGVPVETRSLTVPAFIRCKVARKGSGDGGGWMYAPDNRYGSNVRDIKKFAGSREANATEIEHSLASALQPIIDDGRASAISVTLTEADRSGELIDIKITDRQGEVEQISFRPLRS